MIKSNELHSFCWEIINGETLALIDDDGKYEKIDYHRHIPHNKIDDVPGRTLKTKIRNSIIVTVNLYNYWEHNILNSKYPFKWFGCIQVNDYWIKEGQGAPPYIIFNSEVPDKVENYSEFKSIKKNEFPLKLNLEQNSMFIKSEYKYKRAFFNYTEEEESYSSSKTGYVYRIYR